MRGVWLPGLLTSNRAVKSLARRPAAPQRQSSNDAREPSQHIPGVWNIPVSSPLSHGASEAYVVTGSGLVG